MSEDVACFRAAGVGQSEKDGTHSVETVKEVVEYRGVANMKERPGQTPPRSCISCLARWLDQVVITRGHPAYSPTSPLFKTEARTGPNSFLFFHL